MLGDVQDMLVFAEVARAGSLTRAGVRLGLPKSTVSRRLAALEERIGTRLLERSTRKLVLTEAGEAFLERCVRLADDVDDALALASELSDAPRGTLRVSLVPDLGPLLLAPALARFHARYPQLQLELDESPRYVDLAAERYDLALRAGHLADSSLVARPLLTLHAGVFASPALLAGRPLPKTPADLAALSFLVLSGRTRFDHVALFRGQTEPARASTQAPAAGQVEVALRHTVVVTSSRMQRALALQHMGAMIYPERLCAEDVARGTLVRLLPDWHAAASPLWLVTPSRRLLPRKTTLFIEHLLRELGDSKV